MLTLLRIRNLAIVKDVSLGLKEGLNLLTGETGAGKSILVEALGLALGDRAAVDLLRSGEERAAVEAAFDLGPGAEDVRELLETLGIAPEGDEVIARRELTRTAPPSPAGGESGVRSRQFLCDVPVSLATLRRFGDLMVEIQGQHQHHALLEPEALREPLDRFAGLDGDAAEVRRQAREANRSAEELMALETGSRERTLRLDSLRDQLSELDILDPGAGEDEGLREERGRLRSAEHRLELAGSVYRGLYEDEGAVLDVLGRTVGHLENLAEADPAVAGLAERARDAAGVLVDVALDLRGYRDGAEPDPARLEKIEKRLADYERLARKHGTFPAALEGLRAELRIEIAALEQGEEGLAGMRAMAGRAREAWLGAARALSVRRSAQAGRLADALRDELASLGLKDCALEVEVRAAEPTAGAPAGEHGLDRIGLRLSANPGEPPRPLAEIASGGELSRIMLAVNGVLGARRRRRTLIFDEVDAGIGGGTAEIVGRKLRALAASHQVFVVTHLAPIASGADVHFAVEKRVERGRTVASVRELAGPERVAEIARMLGGKERSPIALRHAEEMIRRSAERHERRSP